MHKSLPPLPSPPLVPHSRQDKLEILEDEGILHEVKHFPCCRQEKYPCSCP